MSAGTVNHHASTVDMVTTSNTASRTRDNDDYTIVIAERGRTYFQVEFSPQVTANFHWLDDDVVIFAAFDTKKPEQVMLRQMNSTRGRCSPMVGIAVGHMTQTTAWFVARDLIEIAYLEERE
ncbi:hypothetical protein BVX99_03545 [bacterium F16]|nr:hypothetical protein BVX99_03545 [bacterium F16]